jgi:hypothetical protein
MVKSVCHCEWIVVFEDEEILLIAQWIGGKLSGASKL